MLISHQLPLAPHAWDESQTKGPRTKESPDTNFHSEKFMQKKNVERGFTDSRHDREKGRWRATRRRLDYVESYNIKNTHAHTWAREQKKREVTEKAQLVTAGRLCPVQQKDKVCGATTAEKNQPFIIYPAQPASLFRSAFQRGKWAGTISCRVNKDKSNDMTNEI